MGLWNFAKTAGKALFGHSASAAEAPPADALHKEAKDLGLDTTGLNIAVNGDKVTVSGAAVSQEQKEKVILAVGNVAGVAQVEDTASAADKPEGHEPVFYTVVHGDTLSAIAQKTLGNANHYNVIFEANRPMLSSPDKIYPGQVLRIPQ